MSPEAVQSRPRVEGEREVEILRAALDVLAEVGYDRLTMDAVAQAAKASKATLYRRWRTKADLVVDALRLDKDPGPVPDTGTLRGDLVESFCGRGGITDPHVVGRFTAVLTAMTRDPEFAEAYRRDVIAPKIEASRLVYERARERGELRDDLDLEVVVPALAAILLHRFLLLGEAPDRAAVTRVVDQVILPATRPSTPRDRTNPA